MSKIKGHVSVSVLAGHIEATGRPIHWDIGQQVRMGDDLHFHITPEIAAQWIPVLTKIANEGKA